MKEITLIITLVANTIFFMGCKKESECPKVEEQYSSTMYGEVREQIIVSIDSIPVGEEGYCVGLFLNEVSDSIEFIGFNVQVVEGLPDSLKIWGNYHEKKFMVDLEFIGVGYSCRYDDMVTEWLNGVPLVGVEQVVVTEIEEVK